jgi:hypothetical protein
MLIPYASAMPNKECQEILDRYYMGWRYLLSPASVASVGPRNRELMYERGYAIDNGVFAYHKKCVPFDEKAFFRLLNRYAEGADWIVIPDSVGNWEETISMFMIWVNKLFCYHKPLMLVAQDGCEENDFREIRGICANGHRMIEGGIGIFVGGSDEFKLSQGGNISRVCAEYGTWCHIGRVNSIDRVRICDAWGATSFDGSGVSRFSKTAGYLSSEMRRLSRQVRLFQ